MAIDVNKPCESNVEWAAQQLLLNLGKFELLRLQMIFEKVDNALYKSWAKEMPLKELVEAIEMTKD